MPNAAPRPWRTVNTRRSHKQQAAATKWGKGGIRLQPMRTAETLPASSWWTTPRSRDEFDAAAHDQTNRMRFSSFGRTLSSPTLDS